MNVRAHKTNGETRLARFSTCEKYRYTLEVQWDFALPYAQFIGLNPSTADEREDDPTLRRVKEFARSWGYGGIVMTNLFAWRDTDRSVLRKVPHPIAEPDTSECISDDFSVNRNDFWLYRTKQQCAVTIAAWGTDGKILYRGAKVKMLLPNMKCIRLTKGGAPEHPLYLPGELKPIPFT